MLGSMLISVGEDGFARAWDSERIEPLAALAHPHALRAVAARDDDDGARANALASGLAPTR